MFLTGALILMALGGLSGIAIAVDEADGAADLTVPHGVSGKIWFDTAHGYTLTDDLLGRRNGGWEARSVFDDPRLSGDTWFVFNTDRLPPRPYGKVWTRTMRIENPDGAWIGTVQGFVFPGSMPQYPDPIEEPFE